MGTPIKEIPLAVMADAEVATSDIGDDAITNAKLANMTRGTVKVGGTSNAPTDLDAKTSGRILVGDGTDLKSVAVSGDVTLAASGAVTIGADKVSGAKATGTLRAKTAVSAIPTVPTAAGTTEVLVIVPFAGTLSSVRVAFKDALAAHDTNFVRFALVNKGTNGAGAVAMLDAGDVNTSKITGGSAIVGYGSRLLTLSGTPANLDVAAGDVLAFQVIGNGTLANTLTEGHVRLVTDHPS